MCLNLGFHVFSLNFALLFKRKYEILIKSRPFFNSCTSPMDFFDCAKFRIKMPYVNLVVLCSVVLLSVVGCTLYCLHVSVIISRTACFLLTTAI